MLAQWYRLYACLNGHIMYNKSCDNLDINKPDIFRLTLVVNFALESISKTVLFWNTVAVVHSRPNCL